MSDSQTDSRTGTSDNGGLPLEREHAHQAGMSGRGGVSMDEMSALVDGVGCHLAFQGSGRGG